MKYFTIERYNAWYVDDENSMEPLYEAHREYLKHIESLQGILSPALLELAVLEHVDDGLIVEAYYFRTLKTMTLILRCGNLQVGYFDLVLRYNNAVLTEKDERTLVRLARATKRFNRFGPSTGSMRRIQHKSANYLKYTPDLYDYELDVTPENLIEHRFLFHPGCWFAIRCTSLEWEKIDREDRYIPDLPDRFPNAPALYSPRRRKNRYHTQRK